MKPFGRRNILVAIFTVILVVGFAECQLGKGKSVIKYLGTTFLMNDGCPSPKCDPATSECQRIKQMVRALYSHCLQSQVTNNIIMDFLIT